MFFFDSKDKQNERIRLKNLLDEAVNKKEPTDVIKEKIQIGNFSFMNIFASFHHAREELELTREEYEKLGLPVWLS